MLVDNSIDRASNANMHIHFNAIQGLSVCNDLTRDNIYFFVQVKFPTRSRNERMLIAQ